MIKTINLTKNEVDALFETFFDTDIPVHTNVFDDLDNVSSEIMEIEVTLTNTQRRELLIFVRAFKPYIILKYKIDKAELMKKLQ